MKNFTLLTILSLFSVIAFGQQANFIWKQDTIATGNLQGMTVNSDSTAVIIGFGNTFKKIANNQMTDVKALKANYDFTGLSSGGNTALLSSRRAKVVDHVTGGKPDVYVSGVILKSTDMGENWSTIDVSKIGTGTDPATSPNAQGSFAKDIFSIGVYNADTFLVYSSWYDISSGTKETRGAVFLTNDGGDTWNSVTPDLGSSVVTSIVIQDSIAYFGGLKNLFKVNLLTDSVTNIYPNLEQGSGSNIYISSITLQSVDEFYITTTTTGFYKSTDGGETFSALEGVSISGSNDLYVLNDSAMVILGGTTKSVVSTDSGATWTNMAAENTIFRIGGVLGDTLYGMGDTYAYKIAVSDLLNKNKNWSKVELNETGDNLQRMWIYDNEHAIIAGYTDMCKYTSDGGQTWQSATLPADFNEDVDFDFISISNNGADAWSAVRRFKIADFASDAGVDDYYMEGLIISTTDDWKTISLIDISKIGANDGNDAALNPQLTGCYGLNPYTIECVDANTAYVYANWYETVTDGTAKSRGRVFKTTNAGAAWTGITEDFGNSYINGIEFIGELGYIAGNNVLYKTTDGGANLEDIYPALEAVNAGDTSIFIKSVTLIDENTFYLPTTSDGVFYTSDGGATFSKLDGVDGTNDIYCLDQNSFMLLGLTSKSYFTNDGGTTWQNPAVGKTVYSIGEVYKDSLFALGAGIIYKIAVSDLDIKTSSPLITNSNVIKLQYHTDHINIVSSNNYIESCYVYSMSGKLVNIVKPNSNICRLNNYDYKPGLYIISAEVEGQKYVDKVVFK